MTINSAADEHPQHQHHHHHNNHHRHRHQNNQQRHQQQQQQQQQQQNHHFGGTTNEIGVQVRTNDILADTSVEVDYNNESCNKKNSTTNAITNNIAATITITSATSTPPTTPPSILCGLIGSSSFSTAKVVKDQSKQSLSVDETTPISAVPSPPTLTTSSSPPPPKPVQRRSKVQQQRQQSANIFPMTNGVKPVDVNNNKQQQKSHQNGIVVGVKPTVIRHKSCPFPANNHRSQHKVSQHQQQHRLNSKGLMVKEKITRVDMVPADDDDGDERVPIKSILPPIDNCNDTTNGHNDDQDIGHHHKQQDLGMIPTRNRKKSLNNLLLTNGGGISPNKQPNNNKSVKIEQTVSNDNDDGNDQDGGDEDQNKNNVVGGNEQHRQLSEWKAKLTRELDVYQNILKQRQQLQRQQSSHQNGQMETTAAKMTSKHGHQRKSSNNHMMMNGSDRHQQNPVSAPLPPHSNIRSPRFDKSKALKLLKNNYINHNGGSNNNGKSSTPETIDSYDDSLGDSWEETTTSTGTSDNNTPTSTPIADTGKMTRMILTTRKKSASEKSNSSSARERIMSGERSEGGGRARSGSSAKRRSTSFKRNVKIITAYEKVLQALESDKTWQKEIAFGRRIGMYRFRGDIGNGNFSQVKIAVHTLTKEKVAVKILDKSRLDLKTQKMLSREIRTMETLHHPNLIRIFEVIESYSKHFIVMELAPGGELFQVISTNGRFNESDAKFFFSQIISAIDHMHQHNLIHRDIKAENVFFADPITVKVGDFGFSTRISSKDELLSTFCGSPPYAAPELFRDESYRGPYVDYWALGVLLYFIVTGMMPFRAQNIVALKKLILDCRYDIPAYVSVECCQLIAGFLQPEPLKRYSLEQARTTRWLHNQPIIKSLPKYDLKNSYAKLIKYRALNSSSSNANSSLDSTDSPKRLARHTIYADFQYTNDKPAQSTNGALDNCPALNDDEKETFHQLMLLGIDESIINDHLDKGSHSHIVGTFRILMHSVLRQSLERLQKKPPSDRNLDTHMSPIRRSTSMSVAPLDRIWAHYARKPQPPQKSNGHNKLPLALPRSAKLTNGTKKNDQSTKTSQSSNDSGKSLANGTKPSRLQKLFNGGRCSTTPPLLSSSPNSNEKDTKQIDDTEQKQKNEPIPPLEPPTPVEEIDIKESKRASPLQQIPTSVQEKSKDRLEGGGSIGSRLTRSFRALKQLLTENNICGNNAQVVQPQTINPNSTTTAKPHVVHKTTTLQIVPSMNAAQSHWIWQNDGKNIKNKSRGRLWRSQTTPDVSSIPGGHYHHGRNSPHLTLPCYCDQNYPLRSSNKKSFTNNRCTIV